MPLRTLILLSVSGKGRRNWIFHSCYCGSGNLLLFLQILKYSVGSLWVFDTHSLCVVLAQPERLAVFHKRQQKPPSRTILANSQMFHIHREQVSSPALITGWLVELVNYLNTSPHVEVPLQSFYLCWSSHALVHASTVMFVTSVQAHFHVAGRNNIKRKTMWIKPLLNVLCHVPQPPPPLLQLDSRFFICHLHSCASTTRSEMHPELFFNKWNLHTLFDSAVNMNEL